MMLIDLFSFVFEGSEYCTNSNAQHECESAYYTSGYEYNVFKPLSSAPCRR